MIKLRPAAWSDRDVIWDWYNEPLRHLVFGTQPDVSVDEYSASFGELLKNDSVALLIALVDNLRVGVVRADRTADGDEGYEIRLYLKPAYCGKGYMTELLRTATAFLAQAKRPRRISMTATTEHPGVLRVFQQAGYQARKLAADHVILEYVCGTPEVSL